ncbi:MAG: DUF502 domain-containing protein [Chlamydiales bacterium]|nr:DUF502 domain-containing protein [Chlamydiales bacterium]
MKNNIGSIFLRGLVTIAPIALTIALVVWLGTFLEDTFRIPYLELFGPKYYFPGLGILTAVVVIFFIGVVVNTYLVQKFNQWTDKLFSRIPLVKTLYGAICDLMSFFKGGKEKKEKVVAFEWQGMRFVGLVTRESFDDLPEGIGKTGEVAVFIPLSYQIGGVTMMISRDKITPIKMSVEDAMRFVVTAGAPGKK